MRNAWMACMRAVRTGSRGRQEACMHPDAGWHACTQSRPSLQRSAKPCMQRWHGHMHGHAPHAWARVALAPHDSQRTGPRAASRSFRVEGERRRRHACAVAAVRALLTATWSTLHAGACTLHSDPVFVQLLVFWVFAALCCSHTALLRTLWRMHTALWCTGAPLNPACILRHCCCGFKCGDAGGLRFGG